MKLLVQTLKDEFEVRLNADRVELFTGPYAKEYKIDKINLEVEPTPVG